MYATIVRALFRAPWAIIGPTIAVAAGIGAYFTGSFTLLVLVIVGLGLACLDF